MINKVFLLANIGIIFNQGAITLRSATQTISGTKLACNDFYTQINTYKFFGEKLTGFIKIQNSKIALPLSKVVLSRHLHTKFS